MLPLLPVSALSLACLAAAWLDVRYRRVPNWLCGVTALAGLTTAMLDGGLPVLGSHFLHMAIVLVAGMVLFRFGVFGGADAKFYTAVAAWFVISKMLLLLLSITFCGLLLLILWFGYRRYRKLPVRGSGGNEFDGLPYGVAIGAGAVLTMVSGISPGM